MALAQAGQGRSMVAGARSACPRAPTTAVTQRSSRRSSQIARVKDISSVTDFEAEVLKADLPVLVDFWAPWCGPCKLMAPLMTWAEKEHPETLKVVKVEHDKVPELVEKYKVYGLPALLVFKDGDLVAGSKSEGMINKAKLADYIKQHAPEVVRV